MNYQTKTMERLFRDYAHENGRENQSAAAMPSRSPRNCGTGWPGSNHNVQRR